MKATVTIPFIVRNSETDEVRESVAEGTEVEVLHEDGHEHLFKIQLESGVVCTVGKSRLRFHEGT